MTQLNGDKQTRLEESQQANTKYNELKETSKTQDEEKVVVFASEKEEYYEKEEADESFG